MLTNVIPNVEDRLYSVRPLVVSFSSVRRIANWSVDVMFGLQGGGDKMTIYQFTGSGTPSVQPVAGDDIEASSIQPGSAVETEQV